MIFPVPMGLRSRRRGTISIITHFYTKIDETDCGEVNLNERAMMKNHNLVGTRGSEHAAATRQATLQCALHACILALTSPEPLRRRRRACTPVTRRRRPRTHPDQVMVPIISYADHVIAHILSNLLRVVMLCVTMKETMHVNVNDHLFADERMMHDMTEAPMTSGEDTQPTVGAACSLKMLSCTGMKDRPATEAPASQKTA